MNRSKLPERFRLTAEDHDFITPLEADLEQACQANPAFASFRRKIDALRQRGPIQKDTTQARAYSAKARARRADQQALWLYNKCRDIGAVNAIGILQWTLQRIADHFNDADLLTRRHKRWNRTSISRALARARKITSMPAGA